MGSINVPLTVKRMRDPKCKDKKQPIRLKLSTDITLISPTLGLSYILTRKDGTPVIPTQDLLTLLGASGTSSGASLTLNFDLVDQKPSKSYNLQLINNSSDMVPITVNWYTFMADLV